MRRWIKLLGLVILTLVAVGPHTPARAVEDDQTKRMVLVELYTSQGCDMCPTAEKIFGAIAEKDSRIVPIAFHVDYFNDPWKDVFSDPLYSQRQMAYNQLYTRPKNPEYGLYYTPMLMIDGEQAVNGRDLPAAQAAIRRGPGPETRRGARCQGRPGRRRAFGHGHDPGDRAARPGPRNHRFWSAPCSARTVLLPTFRRAKTRASRSSPASRPARPSTSSSNLTANHR